jgi:hypothetical protein
MSDQSDVGTTEYDELPLLVDADQLTIFSMDYMEAALPGWAGQPGNPETIMMEANAQMASEVAAQAVSVPDEAMTYLGTTVYGFPIEDGAPSRGDATITFAVTTPATMVPQGTEVSVPHPSGSTFLFETDRDVTAVQGGGTVPLVVIATEYGSDQNGCFGLAELQEEFDGVESIFVNTTINGLDPEDPTDYLGRFSTYLSILTARPILPVDFSRRAQLNPRVGRAVAIDLYQPSTAEGGYGTPRDGSTHIDVERCVTVVIMSNDGTPPPDDLLLEVWQDLDANREVNFLAYTIPPGENGSYTAIDVRAVVRPYPGVTDDDAIAQAQEQIRQWLDPANWGVVPGTAAAANWAIDNKVRIYEAVDWINRATGVFYVVSVEIKKSTDSTWSTTDITLGGAVPMPTAGNVDDITVGE